MVLGLKKKFKSKLKSASAEPFYDLERDGVTNGLLGTWKACRERAHLFLEGWVSHRHSFAMLYGTLFHAVLEQVSNDLRTRTLKGAPGDKYINRTLVRIHGQWLSENPHADAEALNDLELSMLIIAAVVPTYFKYWYKDDFERMVWEASEHVFRTPLQVTVPSGKTYAVPVRGKMDGTFRLPDSPRPLSLRLLETKTKSRVDEGVMSDIVGFERQVNLYVHELAQQKKRPAEILYNVVRRPQLRQKEGESNLAFSRRIAEDVQKRADWYFFRLKILVDKTDLARFRKELVGMVADFAAWRTGEAGHYRNSDACETKYGVCPYLKVCAHGDYSGLTKRAVVFRELEDQL